MDYNLDTPKKVYLKFLDIISNETNSPELLVYEETLVECMVEQIEYMETNIQMLKDKLDSFCIEQHRAEIDRLQYIVNNYIRIRIEKIEDNCARLIKILKSDPQRAEMLMSAAEIKYLDRHFINTEQYLNESVLGKLPIRDASQTFSLLELPLDDKEIFDNTHVFVKALKKTEVLIDSDDGEQEKVTLEPNSIHFLPYSSIRHLVLKSNNDLALILI